MSSTTDGLPRTVTHTRTYMYTWTPSSIATVTMRPSPSPTPTPEGVTIPASLYFITLAIALSLIVSISAAVVMRGSVLRARMRRDAAIRAFAAASSGQYSMSRKPPVLWDIFSPTTTNEKTSTPVDWSNLQPLTLGTVPTPSISPSIIAPAPPQTRTERFLQLPALPPGARAYMPEPTPASYRFRARMRRWFSDIDDLEEGIQVRSPAIHSGGSTPPVEERDGDDDGVGTALEKPVRIGVLLAMPAGEVLLGTLDRGTSPPVSS